MKKFKELIPSYVISFVLSFMMFIFEPITMYSSNVNDFWFDMYIMINPTLVAFLILFLGLSFGFTIIYFISKRFTKNNIIYNIFVLLALIGFICMYIHGNYFAGGLPALDGETIQWESYKTQNIISIIICLMACLGTGVFIKKFTISTVVKNSSYVVGAIFIMLSVSLFSTLLTTNALEKKYGSVSATVKNINVASSDKNFFILLLDAVDSRVFNEVMISNNQYKDLLTDFTYYPDTLSAYPFTRDSIPFILSGIWNENETDFAEYSTNAYNNSRLIKELKNGNYDLNIYEPEIIWNHENADDISNLVANRDINYLSLIKQEVKYFLFKYLPYPLKQFSSVNTLNFSLCKVAKDYDYFNWNDVNAYNTITKNKLELTNQKMFKFIHLEGGHVPFDLDENLNVIENGTYEQKVAASLKLIDAYLNRLKENNIYDDSVIIILADHGYSLENVYQRFNPILYIKGINEHHKMETSNIPISYEDLNSAYLDLLEGKSSRDLFKNIDLKRTRRFIWYNYTAEYHMTEYNLKGKAWEFDKYIKTGKEFNR